MEIKLACFLGKIVDDKLTTVCPYAVNKVIKLIEESLNLRKIEKIPGCLWFLA